MREIKAPGVFIEIDHRPNGNLHVVAAGSIGLEDAKWLRAQLNEWIAKADGFRGEPVTNDDANAHSLVELVVHALDEVKRRRIRQQELLAIIEAAKNWRVGRDRNIVGTAPAGGQRSATGVALIDAVDALKERR